MDAEIIINGKTIKGTLIGSDMTTSISNRTSVVYTIRTDINACRAWVLVKAIELFETVTFRNKFAIDSDLPGWDAVVQEISSGSDKNGRYRIIKVRTEED